MEKYYINLLDALEEVYNGRRKKEKSIMVLL